MTRYAGNFAMFAIQAHNLGIMEAESFAFTETQIHYALGDAGRSYVCGFGNNPPQRPHHRCDNSDMINSVVMIVEMEMQVTENYPPERPPAQAPASLVAGITTTARSPISTC